jgi:hypothetical protein
MEHILHSTCFIIDLSDRVFDLCVRSIIFAVFLFKVFGTVCLVFVSYFRLMDAIVSRTGFFSHIIEIFLSYEEFFSSQNYKKRTLV